MPPKNINASELYKIYQWITNVNQEQAKYIYSCFISNIKF